MRCEQVRQGREFDPFPRDADRGPRCFVAHFGHVWYEDRGDLFADLESGAIDYRCWDEDVFSCFCVDAEACSCFNDTNDVNIV